MTDSSKETVERQKQAELMAEMRICRPREGMNRVYEYAISKGKNAYNTGMIKKSYCSNESDVTGISSLSYKLLSVLESVYTAPYGSILDCAKDGIISTAGEAANQFNFSVKQSINQGVIDFAKLIQYVSADKFDELDPLNSIGDEILSIMLDDEVEIAPELRQTFHVDDILNYDYDRLLFD